MDERPSHALPALTLALVLATAGCAAIPVGQRTTPPADATTERPEYVDESMRERLIALESARVREMLSEREFDNASYGIGGMGSADVTVLNETDVGVYVRVTVPYTYTYEMEPERANENETVTTVEVTSDQEASSVYFVNETTVTRTG